MAAPTLIVETGLITAGANSYAALADALAYHAASVTGAAWTAAGVTDDARTVALIHATRMLDSLVPWPGVEISAQNSSGLGYLNTYFALAGVRQPLRWPRYLVWVDGVLQSFNAVPVRVMQATCELAKTLLLGIDPTADDSGNNIQNVRVGTIDVQFREPVNYRSKNSQLDQALPRAVMALLRPLLYGGGMGAGFVNVRAA